MAFEIVYRFSIWDYIIFVLLLAGSLLIGIYHAKKSGGSTNEYLLGNRQMGIIPVSLSLTASHFSAVFLLGISTEVYCFGAVYIWNLIEGAFVALAISYIFLPVYYNIQCVSMFEYFELRFNKYVQIIGSAAFFLQSLLILSFVIYAPSLIASQATGIDVWICVLIIGIICSLYTSLGGIKAVMWTDTFQCTYMLLSIIAVIIIGCIEVGGISYVWEKNMEHNKLNIFNFNLDPTIRYTFWSMIFGNGINSLTKFAGTQSFIQRYLCTKDLKSARRTVWLNYLGSSIFIACTAMTGLVLYAAYWSCDPYESDQIGSRDQMLPFFVIQKLGQKYTGLPGLFSAGLLSCAISTLSSALNSLSAVTYKQIILPCCTQHCVEKHSMLVIKLLSFLFGLISIAFTPIIAQAGGIFAAMTGFISTMSGPTFGIIILGMLCPRTTPLCAVVGILFGMVTSCWLLLGQLIYKPKHEIPFTSIMGCNMTFYDEFNISISLLNQTSLFTNNRNEYDDISWLYKMSYLWNRFICTLITVITGILFSYIFGLNNSENVDPSLISPVVHKFKSLYKSMTTANSSFKNNIVTFEMEKLNIST